VLQGSVRKGGGQIRITTQLIDALTGAHLWAERFDGSLEDVFDLQDKVAVSVAGVIEPALQAAEIQRSFERPTDDLTAYDLRLRAIPHVLSRERERLNLARDLLGDAIERDSHYGAALAWAAAVRTQLDINGWAEHREACGHEAIDLARRAVQAAPDDPETLGVASLTLGYSHGENIDAAMTMIERSLTLSPSRAHSWLISGWIRLWAGQPESAIEHLNASLRLNPRGVRAMHTLGVGIAHFLNRRFADALPMLHASNQELPKFGKTYRFLAATYAHLGRLDQAQDMIERLRAVSPALVARDAAHWRNPEHRELLLSGLRLAMGEGKESKPLLAGNAAKSARRRRASSDERAKK
jgi:tetratricopeptide (TPR) repeat protein